MITWILMFLGFLNNPPRYHTITVEERKGNFKLAVIVHDEDGPVKRVQPMGTATTITLPIRSDEWFEMTAEARCKNGPVTVRNGRRYYFDGEVLALSLDEPGDTKQLGCMFAGLRINVREQ